MGNPRRPGAASGASVRAPDLRDSVIEAQLKDLEKAQKFIFMEYHAIEDDEALHKIQDVLEERVKAGMEV